LKIRPTIFLTGAEGQVGFELRRSLSAWGEVVAVDIGDLDLRDERAVRQQIRRIGPDLIVNPAAYTAVDQAEHEPDAAHAVNGRAPGVLAQEAARLNIPIVHYSTDYVFDGRKRSPYQESDPPNPQTVYGRSKLAGERAVAKSGARHVILRLSWVYGLRGHNFLRTMLRLGREKKEIQVVDDQAGAPAWSQSIAEASALIARQVTESSDAPTGVYHLPAAGATTWFDYARTIFELAGKHLSYPPVRVVPIKSSAFPSAATRPAYSVLSGERMEADFGMALPHWRVQLEQAIRAGGGTL